MHKTVLQNFVWSIDTPHVAERDVFFRSGKDVIIDDGNIKFDSFSNISFNTYYNIFPSKKIHKYTNIQNLSLYASVDGEVKIEVFGIKKQLSYSYEKNILTEKLSGDVNLNIESWEEYDAIYCRISSYDKIVTVKEIHFYTSDLPSQDISLGCCFCTYNRESYITKNVEKISDGIKETHINCKIFISNNGNPIDINDNEIVRIEKNENFGGAGGFTRSALMAEDEKCSHIIFMDDDIEINFESVFRTFNFYSYVKDEYKSLFLSGSMLSLDEKWLQYERNTLIDNNGMHHQGHFQDLRTYHDVIDNATCAPIEGVAGWWFCAFSTQHFRDYGLPLPIFIRGDDIEFSRRCNAKIISLPGICVWHEPFHKKYSEIMEEYYLLRNILIFTFSTPQNLTQFGLKFFIRKVLRNIATWNYTGLAMNKMAIIDFLTEAYKDNPVNIQKRLSLLNNELKSTSPKRDGFVYPDNKFTHKRLRKKIPLLFLGLLSPSKQQGVSSRGFNRKISDFIMRKEVIVYDYEKQEGESVTIVKSKLADYAMFFVKSYFKIKMNSRKYRKDTIIFRSETSTKKYWKKLLNRN
ncbi:glycosyltransferase family 2 protein [Acetobacter okinawensis]|nr:hypothetical protein [Acetobacter okinawensis]